MRFGLPALIVFAMLPACAPKPASREPAVTRTAAPVAVVSLPAETASASPASEPLTCKTVTARSVPGYCGLLEAAPRAAPGPAVDNTVAVWKRLEGPFRALSGRETALVVLSPEARIGEGDASEPIPPAAYICPGAPPTVYVPASLLALIDGADRAKYPDDFLAFVIGHELGHRMNDLTPDGCQLGAFQRPGKGVQEEELADARSAFFITTAGFSASRIARDDMVSRFLEAEYALGRADTRGRRDALVGALARFDGYEALYQAGLQIALTGDMEAADRLLSWADELVQSHGVPLPELRVVRAITRINRAAEMAPWRGVLALPVGVDHLRCTPVHPGHSGLWEEPVRRVRSPDLERGRKLLKEAQTLLAEAEARGATPATIAAARACAALYLGDARAAAEEQARAEALLATAPGEVKAALADNRALVTFLAHVVKAPAPAPDDTDALRAWTDRLETALGGHRAPVPLAAVIAALRSPDVPRTAPPSNAPSCGKPGARAPVAFAALPTSPAHATCPAGYRLAHALPSADAAARTGSQQGITVCAPDAGDGDLAVVRLAATTEPPLQALERTLRSSSPPPALRELAAWSCHCASLDRAGVSDRGEVIYRASCPALGLDHTVLVVDRDRVAGVIHHSR